MKFCVTCLYWALLITSFVFSWLLFLIVASESAEGRTSSVSTESDDNLNVFENATINVESEQYEVPEIVITRIQRSALENEFLKETAKKVSSSFDTVNTLDNREESEFDIVAESIIQQPNLSQGISETGQAVVLTLVDAAAELQSLAEQKIELDSHSAVKNASSKGSGRRYTEDLHDERTSSQAPKSTSIVEEGVEENNDTDALLEDDEYPELHGTPRRSANDKTPDMVVVVRAEQKVGIDVADTGPSAVDEEVDQVLPEELAKVEEGFGTASELNDTAARARLISEGNRDDVAAAVIIDGLVASGASDSHEDIPSFSEWAQKRLEEAEKKKTHPNASVQNPGGPGRGMGGMKVRSKNYASLDCGAKIVAVNPEAQHAKSVLAATRDEYMLNTCTSRVWFVVELCEAIQAKKIELANFELFSSSPKEFSVYVSDRFPTRDWSPVGHFTAKDERDIQSFALHPQLFGQFIKVELQSHYGSEHFCPISLFRAYGTSEFEVLETETENQRDSDGDDDEDSDEEEVLDADGVPSNLFGSARDAVLSIVKKAAEVLVKSSDLTGNNITKIQQSIDAGIILDNSYDSCTTPRYTILCTNCSDQKFAKVFQLVSCRSRQLNDLLKSNFINRTLRQEGLCMDHGIDLSSDNETREEWKDDTRNKTRNLHATFLTSVFKPEYIVALCNVLATKERKVVMNTSYEIPSSESENVTKQDETLKTKDMDKSNEVPATASSSTIQIDPTSTLSSKDAKQRQESSTEKLESTSSSSGENLSSSESLASQAKPPKASYKEDQARKEPSLSNLRPSSETTEETLQVEAITTAQPVTSLPPPTLNIIEESSSFRGTETASQTVTSVPAPNYGGHEANGNVPHTLVESGEINMQTRTEKTEKTENVGTKKLESVETDVKGKIEPGEQEAKFSSQDHLNFDALLSDLKALENDAINLHNGPAAASNTQPTASTTPQQKESVFLRLSNRIKALERNMSLSGQYLEELSRRYKKQVEEMQRSLERAIAAMSEESRKGEERDLKRLEEIATLRDEIAVLTKSVESILQDQDSWRGRLSAIGQHALFICLEVFVVIIVLSYCRRASDYEEDEEEQVTSKKASVRRKSAEHLPIQSIPSKKIKKRRPSEIASHISSTYHDLMIDDHCQETKKERKRKRKKEANAKIAANMEGKREPVKYKSTSSLVPVNAFSSSSKRASSNDLTKIGVVQGQSGLAKDSIYMTEISSDRSHEQKIISSSKESDVAQEKSSDISRSSDGVEFIETRLFSTNTDTMPVSTSEPNDFSKNSSSKYGGIRLKEGRLSSPSFMKTALGARKKRSLGSNSGQTQGRDENWKTSSGNSLSDRSSQKESPVTLKTLSESIGSANGSAANGLLDESDESRCSSVTPTSWKKEKKSSGLKKMVRKIF